jgi:Zn-dependent peptidase ImmA (M78 family)
MAYYDDQEGVIFINKDDHKSLNVLVNTMIHEYTHYLQNPHHYHVLSLYLPYTKHPLEIEADKVARRDTKKCLKEITEA